MNPITVHGVTLSLKGIIFAAAAVQWLLIVLFVIVTPRGGVKWRKSEVVLVLSTMIFGAAWYGVLRPERKSLMQIVSSEPTHTHGSCDTVHHGDSETSVKQKLGNPDHIRGEEDTRGPAAEVWIYEDTRCAVHLYGDKVDSVE